MQQQLREDLENIIEMEAGSPEALALKYGLKLALSAALIYSIYNRKKKKITEFCKKENIKDKNACKIKFNIANARKTLTEIQKGKSQCKGNKNPAKCLKKLQSLEIDIKNELKKWESKLREYR
jgi:hypothetical protein